MTKTGKKRARSRGTMKVEPDEYEEIVLLEYPAFEGLIATKDVRGLQVERKRTKKENERLVTKLGDILAESQGKEKTIGAVALFELDEKIRKLHYCGLSSGFHVCTDFKSAPSNSQESFIWATEPVSLADVYETDAHRMFRERPKALIEKAKKDQEMIKAFDEQNEASDSESDQEGKKKTKQKQGMQKEGQEQQEEEEKEEEEEEEDDDDGGDNREANEEEATTNKAKTKTKKIMNNTKQARRSQRKRNNKKTKTTNNRRSPSSPEAVGL